MSKLLEHIIRQALFEQTADWDITIEFSQPDGEGPGRVLRYQTSQNNAEKVGAIAGVAVVAKARRGIKNPTSNVSEIIKQIVRLIESNPGHVYGPSGKYDNDRYLYVLATVKSKRKRKIFNLMVFDRTSINNIINMLTTDPRIGVKDISNVIGRNITLLSDDQFALYISRLKRLVKETNDTEINKAWKESGLEQINLDAMRSSIKDPEHDTGAEAVGEMKDVINLPISLNPRGFISVNDSRTFTGTVMTVFDPQYNEIQYKAIQGTVLLFDNSTDENDVTQLKFSGKFKDGVPHSGTLTSISPYESVNSGLMLKNFKGTLIDKAWLGGSEKIVIPARGSKSSRFSSDNSPQSKLQTLTLIQAEQAVYDIGLTYKGTYDDNSLFDTGVLTQTVDSIITSQVAASRYKGFNLTKRLTDRIESTSYEASKGKKFKINTLPRTHPVRTAVKIAVANCKTITAKIESGRFRYADFVDSENKNILEDILDGGRLNTIFKNLNSKLGNPFKQETGDLPYKSIKEGSTDYKEFDPRPKKYIIQLNLLDTIKIDGVTYYQFEYFDTKFKSIRPRKTIKFYAEASQFNETFIKAQQELGNIK